MTLDDRPMYVVSDHERPDHAPRLCRLCRRFSDGYGARPAAKATDHAQGPSAGPKLDCRTAAQMTGSSTCKLREANASNLHKTSTGCWPTSSQQR